MQNSLSRGLSSDTGGGVAIRDVQSCWPETTSSKLVMACFLYRDVAL